MQTTAIAAERLGIKWITCDTSRVALNLARKRLMTETYDYYKLKNQDEGVAGGLVYKEVERLTPSIISKGHSGEKETIYTQGNKSITIKPSNVNLSIDFELKHCKSRPRSRSSLGLGPGPGLGPS